MTDSGNPHAISIDIEKILTMIPHRYPLLLVDRLVEFKHDEYAVGIKNVTFNEPHFLGHFPDHPVMPGVLIVEAMAQTAAIMVVQMLGDSTVDKQVYFMSIDGAKFRKPVVPGDTLYIRVNKERQKGNVWKFSCEATVEGTKVSEAVVTAMIVDKEE